MLQLLILLFVVSPFIAILVSAFKASKDFYEYDEKTSRYISKFGK